MIIKPFQFTYIGQHKMDKLRVELVTLVFICFGVSENSYAGPIEILPIIVAAFITYGSIFVVVIVVLILIFLGYSFSSASNKREWIREKGIALLVFVPLIITVILINTYR